MANKKIEGCIADAIRKADRSYFFENYSKQAASVLKALDEQGYMVVHKTPSDDMIRAGKEAISFGATKPSELVKIIYEYMAKASHGKK